MIRVGFVLEDFTWLGGVNYYRNLFSALSLLPHRRIKPVLFLGSHAPPSVVERLQYCQIVKTDAFNHRSILAILRKGIKRIMGQRDILLGALLARHGIDVLSHAADLNWPRGTRTIGWIPDFQHLHIPSFFSNKELARRDREYERIASNCDRIIVSSAAAQRDFARLAPEAVARCRILRFVPEIDFDAATRAFAPLETKYKIEREYFFLPNQFWMHKNHAAVVDALSILKDRGIHPTVLATGNPSDARSSAHFARLMARVEELGLRDSFRVLGVVPYSDMISLMSNAVAVINPSLFEGWSSTVEEAKILGKVILLSDLPVHREQNPTRAIFFDPNDPGNLADAFREILQSSREHDDVTEDQLTCYRLARQNFASQYEDIVMELMNGHLGNDATSQS
jgi:glycosyltransferase involved in cell wall biosynthesis